MSPAELAQLNEGIVFPLILKPCSHHVPELQSQRDTMTRLREDNRKFQSHYDDLQLRFDEEVYSGGA